MRNSVTSPQQTIKNIAATIFLFSFLLFNAPIIAQAYFSDSEQEASFSDDFNDNSIDLTKWVVAGNDVIEEDGVLKIETNVTDHGGCARTIWLPINGTMPITVSRKTYQQYANNYYIGGIQMIFDTDGDSVGDKELKVEHAQYAYNGRGTSDTSRQYIPRYGTYLSEDTATVVGTHFAGPSPVTWNAWFTEELTYNPTTEILSYSKNGVPQLTLEVNEPPQGDDMWLRILLPSWGWWTGHYEYTDDFVVTEEETPPENQSPVASFTHTPENPAAGEEITFDASDSYDPDGSLGQYAWSFCYSDSGEGYCEPSSGEITTFSYPLAGNYAVSLNVFDDNQDYTIITKVITVLPAPENTPPTLTFLTEEGYDDGLNDQFNTSRGSHPDRATANEDEITFKVLYQDEEAPMHVYASIYDHYGFSGYFYDNDISFPVEDDDELKFRTAEDLDLPYFEETLVGYDDGWLVDGKEGFDKGDSTTITFSSDEVFETITTLVARKVGFTAGDMFAEFTLETLEADGTSIVSINDRIEFTEEEDEFKEIVLPLEANDSNIKHLRLSVTSGSDVEIWIRSIDALNEKLQLNLEENVDIDYTAGVEYSATSTFPKGEYSFYFVAVDVDRQMTRLPEEGTEYFKTGYSNVAFLPGIKASLLKAGGSDLFAELWPVIVIDTDYSNFEYMYLNDGVSSHDNIFTDGIIKKIAGKDMAYDVFSDFVDSTLVENKIINEWQVLPYDWRLPFEGVVINGELENINDNERVYYSRSNDVSDPYILSEINRLADSSPTGKIIIIGHSMGGMIAKYLLQRAEVQASPLYDKIDSLILVASPQLGTPETIGALLHGDGKGQDIDWVVNPMRSRLLGEEMQSAYNLLPSSKYFDSNQAVPVTFHSSVSIIPEMSTLAGTKINSYDKLTPFFKGNPLLSGGLSWEDPEANELDTPNVLRTTLLNNAVDTHSLIDGWHNEEISDDIKVIQIVGTGLQTLNGILYTCWSDDCMESQNITDLERYPDMKENGDGVVVSSSAAAMEFSDTYYVDLPGYAYAQKSDSVISYDHGLIMSAAPVMNLILRSVVGTLDENKLPIFTSTEVTSSGEKYYEGSMESPVDVHVYDSHGRHTGITQRSLDNTETQSYEEQIPNSYYMEFGGHKYVGFGSRDAHSIILDGYDLGTFTFTITETVNDEIVGEKMFKNIPVSETTIGGIVVDNGVESLMLDVDGDEVIDHEVSADEEPDAEQSLSILASVVSSMELHNGTKKSILAKIYAAEQSFEKENKNAMRGQFDALINHIEAQAGKHIQQEDAEKLIEIVQTIQKWIEE